MGKRVPQPSLRSPSPHRLRQHDQYRFDTGMASPILSQCHSANATVCSASAARDLVGAHPRLGDERAAPRVDALLACLGHAADHVRGEAAQSSGQIDRCVPADRPRTRRRQRTPVRLPIWPSTGRLRRPLQQAGRGMVGDFQGLRTAQQEVGGSSSPNCTNKINNLAELASGSPFPKK